MINQPERPEANRVTIEDLLRVKRAERPSPEFWSRFEQDLRAKQLAAIVEPRPWWITLRLPQVGRAIARFQVPIGAAAALALSFVAVREYRPFDVAPGVTSPSAVVAVQSNPVLKPRDGIAGDVVAQNEIKVSAREATSSVATPASTSVIESVPTNVIFESMPAGPGELLAMIPWTASPQTSPFETAAKPVILGELPQVYFAAAIKPAGDHYFAGSVEVDPIIVSVPSKGVDLDAVAEVSPVSPREVRRNRILASLVVADNSGDADRSRLGQAREIVSDDRLYDSVRRLGMGGDRLTLKF